MPKASSLALVMGQEFDVNPIFEQIIGQIQTNCTAILSNSSDELWNAYHKHLFRIHVPMSFEDLDKNQFRGIIQGVTPDGKLQVLLENDIVTSFGVKEIQMMY